MSLKLGITQSELIEKINTLEEKVSSLDDEALASLEGKVSSLEDKVSSLEESTNDRLAVLEAEYKIEQVTILGDDHSKWTQVPIEYNGLEHYYDGAVLDEKYKAVVFVMSNSTNNQILHHCVKQDNRLVVLVGSVQDISIHAMYKDTR
jgi:hypothetical protein